MSKLVFIKNKFRHLVKHQGLRKYSINAGWLMVDKIFRLLLGLFVGVWLARYLMPVNYGLLSFAVSFAGLFSAVGTLGLDQTVIRDIAKNPAERDIVMGTSFLLKAVGSIVMLVMILAVLGFMHAGKTEYIVVAIVAVGQVFISFNVFDFYFRSQVKAKFSGLSNSIGILISAVSKISFILADFSVIWFAIAILIEQVAIAFFLVYFYIRNGLSFLKWKFSMDTLKRLMRDSWPLLFSGMAVAVFMKIDQVMIKMMMDNRAVGEYAAAAKLSQAWYFVPIAISQSVYPSLIKTRNEDAGLYYIRLQNLFTFMAWMGIIVAVVMTFASGFIINVLYGEAYAAAGAVLSINIWAGVFIAISTARGLWINIENLQKYSFYTTLCGAAANVALNLFLIPAYGINGAAVASVISYFIAIFSIGIFGEGRGVFYRMLKTFNPVFAGRSLMEALK